MTNGANVRADFSCTHTTFPALVAVSDKVYTLSFFVPINFGSDPGRTGDDLEASEDKTFPFLARSTCRTNQLLVFPLRPPHPPVAVFHLDARTGSRGYKKKKN